MYDFYYLHRVGKERKPPKSFVNGSFKAMSLTKKQLDKMNFKPIINLFPIVDNWLGGKEIFIRGGGLFKVNEKRVVEVPLYDYENEGDWNEYLGKYGMYCLFYSLTGEDYFSADCCLLHTRNEFQSLIWNDIDINKYQIYIKAIKRIQEIQKEKLIEYGADKWDIEKCLFYPSYNFGFSWLVSPPYLDTIRDDEKLERCYRMKRSKEMSDNVGIRTFKDAKAFCDIIDMEMDETNGVFPICMSDRIKFLYGEECQTLYRMILDEFKMN